MKYFSPTEGTLTFFIRGIRYMILLFTLCDIYCDIYRFQNREHSRCVVPALPGQSDFWGHMASGHFDSDDDNDED